MAEWLKAHAWKACVRESVPWVRIPLSPPSSRFAAFHPISEYLNKAREIRLLSCLVDLARLDVFLYNSRIEEG